MLINNKNINFQLFLAKNVSQIFLDLLLDMKQTTKIENTMGGQSRPRFGS